jgi:chaperonin cofactor prefoldin
MATTEDRVLVLETQLKTLMETLATQLGTMNERFTDVHRRLDDLRAWLIALTGLAGAQLTAMVAMALTLARR